MVRSYLTYSLALNFVQLDCFSDATQQNQSFNENENENRLFGMAAMHAGFFSSSHYLYTVLSSPV